MTRRGKKGTIKIPAENRRAQHEEWGRERSGATECPRCGNVHFLKRWYSGRRALETALKKKIGILKPERCPACKEIAAKQFEGEVMIVGVPEKKKTELRRLIKNFGSRALLRDPQDRIIAVRESTGGRIIVTTTENQLAVRLAKKVKEVFKTAHPDILYSKEPSEVVRVRVSFRPA